MLLTKIPHFKEVMVVSFECEHCGFRSSPSQIPNQTHSLHTPLAGEELRLSQHTTCDEGVCQLMHCFAEGKAQGLLMGRVTDGACVCAGTMRSSLLGNLVRRGKDTN